MSINPEDVKSWSEAAGAALSALKAAKDLLPSGNKKEDAERAIEAAERDLQLAVASAAKELGFDLCKRHWPPGIMVLVDGGHHVCRECGKPNAEIAAFQSTPGMKAETAKVLKLFFDTDKKFRTREIAAKFGFPDSVAKYHVGILVEKQLIWNSQMVVYEGSPVYYEITQSGREFIMQNGMA